METRGFCHAGLNACGSTQKGPVPEPSGTHKRRPQPDRIRDAVGNHAGFPKGKRPWEAVHLVNTEVVAAGTGRCWNRVDAVGLPAFRLFPVHESDCLADSRPLARSSASKTAGRFGRSVRKVRERENVLRRIGALLPNSALNCGRTGRKGAVGLDGQDMPGGTPADEGAAR